MFDCRATTLTIPQATGTAGPSMVSSLLEELSENDDNEGRETVIRDAAAAAYAGK